LLLVVPLALSAGPGDSRLLGYTDNNPSYALSTTLTVREDFIGKISFHTLSMGLDLVVGLQSANSQSSLFSSFSLPQTQNLENLPQTESTFSRGGWTAGMEWKSCSPDTGPRRSKPKSVNR
jgi:hypothetical protein